MDYVNPDILLFLCHLPGGCNIETLLEPSGIITSPGYPDMDYPNEADCQWIIQTRGDKNIKLTFNVFDTEYGFDKLIVGGVTPPDDTETEYLVSI